MTLQQLNYLAQVVRHGSINQAAKRLFVSQSSISNAIRDLEEEVGIEIFNRGNKGVELTEEGERFCEHIQPILEQERKVAQLYGHKRGQTTLRLRVSSQHYPFTTQAFVELLASIGQSAYDLQLKETSAHKIIEDVSSGEADLGILFMSDMTRTFLKKILNSRDLEFHLLGVVKPHAFFRKSHPLAGRASVNARELDSFPYVIYDQARTVSLNFSEEVVLTGFEPSHKTISVNDRCTFYSVLAHTDAFSIGTGLLPENFSDPRIIAVPISAPADRMELGWIERGRCQRSSLAQDYLQRIKTLLGEG